MMESLGVLMTCYNEVEAVGFALRQFHKFYPNSKVYLVSESGDKNLFHTSNSLIKINYEEDTMGFYYSKEAPKLPKEFYTEENQQNIKKAFLALLSRINKAIEYCQSDFILLMDPDVLIRGPLNIPPDTKLLGSLYNNGTPKDFKEVLSKIEGAIVFDSWGATPGIISSSYFKQAYHKFLSLPNLLDDLSKSWYAMYAHDIIIPTLFALIGIKEVKNNDLTECNTDVNWESSGKPLIHHYKKYYPNCKERFPWFQLK